MKPPGIIDAIKTELNWGGMFPDPQQQQDQERYRQYKATGKIPPLEQEKKGLLESIATKIGDIFSGGKIVSPVPDIPVQQGLLDMGKGQQAGRIMGAQTSTQESTPIHSQLPSPTPTPSPSKLPPGVQSTSDIVPPQPPEEFSKIVDSIWGSLAPKAKIVMWTENGGFRPDAINENTNGTKDIGLFQVNTGTFDGFLKRKPQLMQAHGLSSYQDLFDPVKNAQMAKLIFDEQGWGAWYGPKNKGFTIK